MICGETANKLNIRSNQQSKNLDWKDDLRQDNVLYVYSGSSSVVKFAVLFRMGA